MKDIDIREVLFDYLDEKYGRIRILEEKVIYGSRADAIGIIDDKIIGFEIKSDNDSYTRLKTQIKDYEKYCDECYLVVGKKHEKHANEHVPSYWGILVADENEVILQREASVCPKVKIKYQLDMLWRREIDAMVLSLAYPAYKSYSKAKVEERIIEKTDPFVLKHLITEILFNRDYTIFDKDESDKKYRKTKTGITVKNKKKRRKEPNLRVSKVVGKKKRKVSRKNT